MTRYEITFAQYDRFCKEITLPLPADEGWGRGERPAINVSYDDAVKYAAWLSRKTGHTYRLPTETEWELVARAGTTTHYWWGDAMEPGRANCAGCGVKDGRQTAPVGSFGANPWGLYDTVGNVWEWTSSTWFGASSRLPFRVVKGGGWNRDSTVAAANYRVFDSQVFRSPSLGFRLVREGSPPGQLSVTASTLARVVLSNGMSGDAGPDQPLVLLNLDPGEYRVVAAASGFADKVEKLRVMPNAMTEVSLLLESNEAVAWRACDLATAIAPCRYYIKEYPDGAHASAARNAIESFAWQECDQATDAGPCRGYLKDYPGGKFAKVARERVHAADWHACVATTNSEPCTAYLKEYPKGAHARDAADKIEDFLWRACAVATVSEPCTAYVKEYPKGAHARDAADKVEGFQWQACADAISSEPCNAYLKVYPKGNRAQEATKKVEGFQWLACTSSSASEPCRDYLETYPRGEHAKEARKRIATAEDLEFQAASKTGTADAWLAFIETDPSAARVKEAKRRLKALKASPSIEFPKKVGSDWRPGSLPFWKWTVTFKEKSGKVGYHVSGSGRIRDKKGGVWVPSGGSSIERGDVEVPAGCVFRMKLDTDST